MANRDEHRVFGALIGSFAELLFAGIHNRPVRAENILFAALGGVVGSHLPDIIEPAIHPHHRDVAHSLFVGVGVAHGATKVTDDSPGAAFLRGNGAGYVSHLALDASTPRSIPLLSRRIG